MLIKILKMMNIYTLDKQIISNVECINMKNKLMKLLNI